MIFSPFFVRVLMFVVCIFLLTAFVLLSGRLRVCGAHVNFSIVILDSTINRSELQGGSEHFFDFFYQVCFVSLSLINAIII